MLRGASEDFRGYLASCDGPLQAEVGVRDAEAHRVLPESPEVRVGVSRYAVAESRPRDFPETEYSKPENSTPAESHFPELLFHKRAQEESLASVIDTDESEVARSDTDLRGNRPSHRVLESSPVLDGCREGLPERLEGGERVGVSDEHDLAVVEQIRGCLLCWHEDLRFCPGDILQEVKTKSIVGLIRPLFSFNVVSWISNLPY